MSRVYVGTFAKYNNGNLFGKWVNISNCKDYNEFIKICRDVHKDEAEPEFMIQDTEGLPEGLQCGEWLTRQEFDDIRVAELDEQPGASCKIVEYSEKAVAVVGDTRKFAESFKACGGRFNPLLTCGPGWIFSKFRIDAVRAILAAAPVQAVEAGRGFEDSSAEFIATLPEKDRKYYTKRTAAAIKINGGYLVLDSPTIENRFCFSDEGPEYEVYKSLCADKNKLREYFINENLSDLNKKIERLKDESRPAWVTVPEWRGCVSLVLSWGWHTEKEMNEAHEITNAERGEILKALEFVRAEFQKRLNTYLKRYDIDKIRIWSYWVDA